MPHPKSDRVAMVSYTQTVIGGARVALLWALPAHPHLNPQQRIDTENTLTALEAIEHITATTEHAQ